MLTQYIYIKKKKTTQHTNPQVAKSPDFISEKMTENANLQNEENNTTVPTKENPYGRNLLIFGTSNFGRHLLTTTSSKHTTGNDKLRGLEKTHTTNIKLILTYEMNQLKNNIKLKSTRNFISNSDIILIHILGIDVRLLTN